jgi:hypothetical protein
LPILFQNYGHTSLSTVRCDFCSCSFSSSTPYPRLLRERDNFAQIIILCSDSPLNVSTSGNQKKTTASHFALKSVMRSYPFFLPDAIEFSLQNTTTKRPSTRSSSSSPLTRELAAGSRRERGQGPKPDISQHRWRGRYTTAPLMIWMKNPGPKRQKETGMYFAYILRNTNIR